MPILRDLRKIKFDRLTPIRIVGRNNLKQVLWLCSCSCGEKVVIPAGNLITGNSKSCGCLQRELAAVTAKRVNTVHGHSRRGSKSPEYSSWSSMRNRCLNPNNEAYEYYGGRGITVCERWNSFANFLEDVGTRPAGKSIDRINNDGNYEPNNVRWVTSSEQIKNQRHRRGGTWSYSRRAKYESTILKRQMVQSSKRG